MHIRLYCFLFAALLSLESQAQNNGEHCGTMLRLEEKFRRNPALKTIFEKQQREFNEQASGGNIQISSLRTQSTTATIYIPVVFHIVLTNPTSVTNAQIQAQLDTLNKSFSGINGDSVKIPVYFKPLFGKSTIQFCLARRTPDGEATSGIVRHTTSQPSFSFNDAIKHNITGGADSWNTGKYFNIWIGALSGSLLGYATFPGEGAEGDQGVVVDYRSLPGGTLSDYNGGKTMIHEVGHFFNLFHIWGDDNGACSGTDHVDDTPNQAGATNGCFSGIRTDNCSGTNGVMYQNYMDYTNDACMVMFTSGQVSRMEFALSGLRNALASSDGCMPPVYKDYNVQLETIDHPEQRLCAPEFSPRVTIKNRGAQTITSLQISIQLDNGSVNTINWTGSLPSLSSVTVNIGNFSAGKGTHVLTAFTALPNGQADEDLSNDTVRMNLNYTDPVTSVSEGFELNSFPPQDWDIVNRDRLKTWEKVNGVSKSGSYAVMMNNYNYEEPGQKDDLRLPGISLSSTLDSAFLTFQVAAATFTHPSTTQGIWDTLEVLASTDCGITYTSLYKKWGSSLVTRPDAATAYFTTASSEWRKDSVNLASFKGSQNLLIAFRNTSGSQNNIYLDDIQLRTVTVNPNLKSQGYLITPNPTYGSIAVQFYPQPTGLKSIQLFNALGQKIMEQSTGSGQPGNSYRFDLSAYAKGIYYLRVVFADRVVVQRVLKL